MKRGFVKKLVLCALSLGVAAVVWPRIDNAAKAARIRVEVVTQPREEIVVSGFMKHRAPPFSLETLDIELPGKPAYSRQVSLDANRSFELALGKPIAGNYRVAGRNWRANWLSGERAGPLQTPTLTLDGQRPQAVEAVDYNWRRLAAFLALVAGLLGGVLAVWQRRQVSDRQNFVDKEATDAGARSAFQL